MSTNRKIDIKDKLKECQCIINSLILSKTNLFDKSIAIYKHVWGDFVKLSIDSDSISKYIR